MYLQNIILKNKTVIILKSIKELSKTCLTILKFKLILLITVSNNR